MTFTRSSHEKVGGLELCELRNHHDFASETLLDSLPDHLSEWTLQWFDPIFQFRACRWSWTNLRCSVSTLEPALRAAELGRFLVSRALGWATALTTGRLPIVRGLGTPARPRGSWLRPLPSPKIYTASNAIVTFTTKYLEYYMNPLILPNLEMRLIPEFCADADCLARETVCENAGFNQLNCSMCFACCLSGGNWREAEWPLSKASEALEFLDLRQRTLEQAVLGCKYGIQSKSK